MNRDRFFTIVEAYGTEPRRWPEAEREAALAFSRTEAAAAILAQAQALDGMLDESRPLAPSRALRARVIEAAPRPRPTRLARFSWWAPGAGLAAAGVAGLVFGAALLGPHDVQTESVLAEAGPYDVLDGSEPVESQL